MLAQWSRRQLIGALGSTVLGGSFLLGDARSAFADAYQRIEYGFEGDHWNPQGDPKNRKQIIDQAMEFVQSRFLDLAIARNVYALDNVLYGQTDDLWEITQLDTYYKRKHLGRRDILWYQLRSLREWYRAGDPALRKPNLTIHSYDREERAIARAHFNTVRVVYEATGFRVLGDFSIYLNFHYLGEAGCFSDPLYWAVTIAHEMLHNLGHDHDKAVENPLYQRRQMIVFENAFHRNGSYRFGLPTADILCGGPPV